MAVTHIIVNDPIEGSVARYKVVPAPAWYTPEENAWVVADEDALSLPDFDPEFDAALMTFNLDEGLYELWQGGEFDEQVAEWQQGAVTLVEN